MVEHLFKFSVFILLFLQCVLTFAESNNTKNDTSAGVIATTKAEEGLTIVAFGNGAPDIFSAIAAFTNSNPSTAGVAIGGLLGAALMVTTVVAGLVATTQSFDAARRPFLRDMIFFIVTVFWLFFLIYNKQITLASSAGFLALYALYVAVALVGRYIHQKQRTKNEAAINSGGESTDGVPDDERAALLSSEQPSHSENSDNNEADAEGEWMDAHITSHHLSKIHHHQIEEEGVEADETATSTGEEAVVDDDIFLDKSILQIFWIGINPVKKEDWVEANMFMKALMLVQIPWNLVCKLTIPLVITDAPLLAWNRPLHCLCLVTAPVFCLFATKGGHVYIKDVFPLWGLMLIVGAMMGTSTWFTTSNQEKPRHQWILAYIGFVVVIIWTYITANEIVNLIQTFGVVLNVSNVIMGLTFLAWGNSIADVVADVTLAKQGFPRMSLSACIGGPLFNVLIGVGLSCTINAIKKGKPTIVGYTLLEPVLCGSVLFGLCFNFVVLPICKFRLTPTYGWVLIAIYIICLSVCVLVGLNVIG